MILIFPKKSKWFTRLNSAKGNLTGFTLLELLFVISIFSTTVLAVFAIVQYPLSQSMVSISRLTAVYLAQEGIELVRNLRDKNWVQSPSGPTPAWYSGLVLPAIDCRDSDSGCEIDFDDTAFSVYGLGRFLKINSANGFYYGTGVDSKFKRKITITPATDGSVNILKVVSTVFCTEKGQNCGATAQENLYPWWRP